jgi:hypothetical protein
LRKAINSGTTRKMRRESFSNVDTDSLARIGLFRGQSERQKYQEDMRRLVTDIQRDIAEIRQESEG